MAKKSMIDSDFIDDDDVGSEVEDDSKWTPPEPQEVIYPDKADKAKQELTVEISDDTPEDDKGKWVAGEEDELELPAEDEVRGYAKGAQKRISQMTARIHAERRRADEIARENQEAVALAKRLMAENNSLKDFVVQGEKVLMGEHQGRLKAMLDQAKVAYREAHDAGDATGMIAAQEAMASAIAKMERAAATRPMQLQKEDETVFTRMGQGAQPGQAPAPDENALKWAEKNKWFGRDDAMTGYALGFHKQLVERDGIMPDQPEYYSRLNSEMRRRFPDRFSRSNGSLPERRQAPPVGAVSRTSNVAPRTVRITESQARLAKRLGLTVEQYAQQIVAEQDNRDGRSFTHT